MPGEGAGEDLLDGALFAHHFDDVGGGKANGVEKGSGPVSHATYGFAEVFGGETAEAFFVLAVVFEFGGQSAYRDGGGVLGVESFFEEGLGDGDGIAAGALGREEIWRFWRGCSSWGLGPFSSIWGIGRGMMRVREVARTGGLLGLKSKLRRFTGLEGAAAGFEDGGGFAGALDGGEVFALPENEVGDALVAVAGLAGEVAVGIGGVAEEEGVGALVAVGVGGVVVTPMGLVDTDFALVMEGEEALLGVDFGFGGDPG